LVEQQLNGSLAACLVNRSFRPTMLLILDEAQTGISRTGQMYSLERGAFHAKEARTGLVLRDTAASGTAVVATANMLPALHCSSSFLTLSHFS
jgi:hypothetical protein